MKILARLEEDVPELDENSESEQSLSVWERRWGCLAILLQLYATTYADLMPDPILSLNFGWRFFRLAGHFIAVPIYIAGYIIGKNNFSDSSARNLLASILLTYVTLTGIEVTNPQYTQLYFLASLLSSLLAWLLLYIPRFRKSMLGCEEENKEHWYWNVFAFDFFCRVLWLGFYWYIQHYDPTGTFKPHWANNLG